MSEVNRSNEHTLLLSDVHDALQQNVGRLALHALHVPTRKNTSPNKINKPSVSATQARLLGLLVTTHEAHFVDLHELLHPSGRLEYLLLVKDLDVAGGGERYLLTEDQAIDCEKGPLDEEDIGDLRDILRHAEWKDPDFDPNKAFRD